MEATISNPVKVNNVRRILYFTFGLLPIITGIDKFIDLLTDWDKYIIPLKEFIPFAPHTFMMIVGVIEIIAGIIVFVIPRIGAYIVSLWLLGIVIVLVLGMNYFDVAARDLVMAIAAFCLGELCSFKQNETMGKLA